MIFPKVFLLIGKKWIEEKGGSDGKTSVSCQGPPTTMIYDFADGAQTVHTVSFPKNMFFVGLFICWSVGLDAFKEDGKTSVFCQGPPTTMIYDFADWAQTFHNVFSVLYHLSMKA